MSSELTSSPTLDNIPIETSSTTPDPDNEKPSGPTLPIEIISKIVTYLQHDRKYATLASMALANSTFYDLVIPKLYETITITKTNMLKLKYGHDTQVAGHFPRPTQEHGVCTDDADCPSSVETYRSHSNKEQPRKDRAVRYCRRLIIDVPMSLVKTIENLACRLPCQPYGRVEEIVFNLQGISYVYAYSLDTVLPPSDLPVGRIRTMDQQLFRSRRVVIHTPIDLRLSYQIREFHRLQLRQLSLRGEHLGASVAPYLSFAYATVKIRFASDPTTPDQKFRAQLAAWLVHDFEEGDWEDFRIQLLDIPSLITPERHRQGRKEDVTRASRKMLSAHVHHNPRVQRNSDLTAAIMDRIDFEDSEDGEGEYPVLKPRPVSHTLPRIKHGG